MLTPHALRRRETAAALVDFSEGQGLEIGPLDAPIVPQDRADVRYADVFDKEGLEEHYRSYELVDGSAIPEIDYVLVTSDGGARPLAEAVVDDGPFDWVVASHVLEHVPDVASWLRDVSSILAPDGRVVLVLPDRRFCFDIHRAQTTVGQMLEAHLSQARTPSVRAVYDHFRTAAHIDMSDAWNGSFPMESGRVHTLEYASDKVAEAMSGDYVDCHVWTFVPETFRDQLAELYELGLTDLVVETLIPTEHGQLDFYAVLRRPEGTGADTTSVDGPRAFRGSCRSEVVELTTDLSEARDEVARLNLALDAATAEVHHLRERVKDFAGLATEQMDQLAAVRASTRWRVGGVLVAPIGVARRIKGEAGSRGS